VAVNDIARVYATSFLEVGQDKKNLPELEAELRFVSELLNENKSFKIYLESPSITKDSKKEFVKKVFSNNFSEYMMNFLFVLIENDRQGFLNDIYESFVESLDILNGRQKVTVVSNAALDKSTTDKIISELGDKFKKEIILTEQINHKILGGIILKVGDLMIDGSLSKNLKNIRNNLLNSKVRSEMAYED